MPVHAQWITQSFELKAGWNAVYLHVDASHATLDQLVGSDSSNPIQEVWLWRPDPTSLQFIDSPQLPTGGTPWVSWVRTLGPSSELQRLIGNNAYLVRVAASTATYSWPLKGRPLPPQYQWTTTGLNFLGFPTPATPPVFEDFLAKAPELLQRLELYGYQGGDLGPGNPARIFNLRTRPVQRGEAFWMRSGALFNRYFGPFEVSLEGSSGLHFGEKLGQLRFRLRNLVAHPLTVTLTLAASEAAPAGQTAITGPPILLVRGDLNTATLTYPFTELNAGPRQWTLAAKGQPGSEVEVFLGLNRFALTAAAGSQYAAILQFADSSNFSRVDVPVSATVATRAGLWVGQALVNQVGHYLKTYQRDPAGKPIVTGSGPYAVAGVNTTLGSVAQPYSLRLILHSAANGVNPSMLQRVYYGMRNNELAVTTRESLIDPAQIAGARRFTAVHLPWKAENNPWTMTGEMRQGANVSAVVSLAHDEQASNPFLHTYHPDHDNRNATFTQALPQGQESYSVSRQITLSFTAPGNDFASLTGGGETLAGSYEEAITIFARGTESRRFDVRGHFALNRLTDIPVLTQP